MAVQANSTSAVGLVEVCIYYANHLTNSKHSRLKNIAIHEQTVDEIDKLGSDSFHIILHVFAD